MASLLVRHIKGLERPRMPFDGPPWLSEAETGLIIRWIRDGARNVDEQKAPVPIGAKLRLRGILQAQWVLDETAFLVTDSTDIREVTIGSPVELRARVTAYGDLIAERLSGR